jgi:hypothetical protein
LAPAAFLAPCSACWRLLFAFAEDRSPDDVPPGSLVGGGVEPGGPGVLLLGGGVVVAPAEWPGRLPGALAPIVGSGGGATLGDERAGVLVEALAVALNAGAVDVPAAEVPVGGELEAVVPSCVEPVWGGPGL